MYALHLLIVKKSKICLIKFIGLSRKKVDIFPGEKGDRVRRRRKDPKKCKKLWILVLLGLKEDDDEEDEYWWLW